MSNQLPESCSVLLNAQPFTKKLICRVIFKLIYIILSVALLFLFLFLLMKQPRKNWEIEKSVMKPNIIDSSKEAIIFNFKRFVNGIQKSKAHFETFETSMRKYGIRLTRQNFVIENKRGWNFYGFLPSRKESLHRCFLFTFDRRNPLELLIADLFVDQFFTKNSNIGISVILIGYDGKFKNYNLAISEFFKQHFSENPIFSECNYSRDGLSIEIEKNTKNKNLIEYFPCKLIRWERRNCL